MEDRRRRRRRRRLEKPKAPAGENRINKLPDDILCRILSFLPTKKAVATSILSKRWNHLWISVPNFNLTNIRIDNMKHHHKFNKFLHSVLASRDDAGCGVDGLHLDIEYWTRKISYRSFPHVLKWISLVAQRKLKHLYLNHEVDDSDDNDAIGQDGYFPKVPSSIFTCRTLVSLNLNRLSVEGRCVSSVEFGFPMLKTLDFEEVSFGNDRNFVLLLSACPVLEDLQLFNCWNSLKFWEDPVGLQMFRNFSLPKLTRADIIGCDWYIYPLKAFSTAKSLCLDNLNLYTEDDVEDDEDDEENQLQRPRHYEDIPIFHNLTHLKVRNDWDLVLRMLCNCPKLQSLELTKERNNRGRGSNQENSAEEPEFVPQCLSLCLRTCTIRDIGSLESELMLATFILKNASNLQIMKIKTDWSRDKHEVEAKLSQCPKASATCQLLVD